MRTSGWLLAARCWLVEGLGVSGLAAYYYKRLEPITHLLTGACISRAGLNRTTGYATLMLTLSAEFPDFDILWNFKGPVEAMAHHRGFTHTLLGAPVDSAIVLGFVYAYHRWRQSRRGESPLLAPRWGLLFGFGVLAVLSHILLDFTNSYGVRPFAPFSWRWYSWDIVFLIEPLILLALVIGLVLPSIFSLVGEEVGARRERFRGRWPAIFALLAICAIWWVRDYQHRKAVTALNAIEYRGGAPRRVAAMPYPLNPFAWAGVVETQKFFAQMPVDSRNPEADPLEGALVQYKPEENAVTLAAKRSPLGRVYLDWARFPLLEIEPLQSPLEGYVVRFRDLRFAYAPLSSEQQFRVRGPLSASVELDRQLHVVAMRMGNRVERP